MCKSKFPIRRNIRRNVTKVLKRNNVDILEQSDISARDVMVIVVGNGHGDTNSILRRD